MALSRAGADRQIMHERLRLHALAAWGEIQAGGPNPLAERIVNDPELFAYVSKEKLISLMDASQYLGDAPRRARLLAEQIRAALESRD
jgi:adenylosuccinate lyase